MKGRRSELVSERGMKEKRKVKGGGSDYVIARGRTKGHQEEG